MRGSRKKYKKIKKIEEEGNFIRKRLDEETIKTKFENNSNILDDILRSQKPSNDKTGLGYDNERNSKFSSFTNRERDNRRGCANVLKSPIKHSQNFVPSYHYNDRTGMILKRPRTSRVQQIFLGRCYTCHNFGHMARECKLRKNSSIKFQEQRKGWKRMEDLEQNGQRFLKNEGSFYGYCRCCHKFGHKADNCIIKEEDEGMIRKEDTNTVITKDIFCVSYVTILDTLQDIARMGHADLPRKLIRKYGR